MAGSRPSELSLDSSILQLLWNELPIFITGPDTPITRHGLQMEGAPEISPCPGVPFTKAESLEWGVDLLRSDSWYV